MARNEAGLETALAEDPGAARGVLAGRERARAATSELNQSLEKAGRVADFLELGELMCLDALEREESCGGHFREEYQTPDGEAQRDDEHFCHVAAWEYAGRGQAADPPRRSRSSFENVHLAHAELQVSSASMNLTLHVWRQKDAQRRGPLRRPTTAPDISPDMSFLEMLDVVNEGLIGKGEDPIAFDHDCREGICGTCGMVINGAAARPAPRHHRLPAPHAQLQGRRHASRSSPGARRPSR